MYQIFERISAKIYWDLEENIPLLREEDGKVAALIKATPPRDLRPAFEPELSLLKEVVRRECGEDCQKVLIPDDQEVVLLNKIAYPDAADEVIVGGHVIGHRFFDLKTFTWRFKPLYVGVNTIIEHKVGYYAIVDLPRIKRPYVIHKSHIVEANLPQQKGMFVALATKDEKYYGVGELLRGKRIRVLKSWRKRPTLQLKKSNSWDKVVKANEEALRAAEEEAISFLREVHEQGNFGKNVFVSFSGGKDSMATLLVTLKALGKVPILFNDTGLEFSETVDYVKRVAQKYGLELLLANAGDRFFENIDIFGPPARDYRWCCKVLKLAPILNAIRKRFGREKVLSIVGQRKYESIARARSPRTWVNRWLPNVLAAAPIMEWTALHVWLYLILEKAEVNKLYFEGFDRLGCWLCPACEIAEFMTVKEKHPDLWEKWEKILREWQEKISLNEEWIRLALWRWKRVPGDQARLVKEKDVLKKCNFRNCLTLSVSKKNNRYEVEVKTKYTQLPDNYAKRLLNVAPVLGYVRKENSHYIIVLDTGKTQVEISSDGKITLSGDLSEECLKKLAHAILRSSFCAKCSLCAQLCPSGALKVEEHGIKVDPEKCTRCGECLKLCPLTEYIDVEIVFSHYN